MFKIKNAYQIASRNDGIRILVDRLWPRGVSKEKADIKLWLKDISPSTKLVHGLAMINILILLNNSKSLRSIVR